MKLFSTVTFIIGFSLAIVGCGSKDSGSSTKDITYIDSELATLFVLNEACDGGGWQDTTDNACKFGAYVNGTLKHERSSLEVYSALGLNVPCGKHGEAHYKHQKELVDAIEPGENQLEAQKRLQELRTKIDKKNLIKSALVPGSLAATCFKDSNIKGTDIKCSTLEEIVYSPEDSDGAPIKETISAKLLPLTKAAPFKFQAALTALTATPLKVVTYNAGKKVGDEVGDRETNFPSIQLEDSVGKFLILVEFTYDWQWEDCHNGHECRIIRGLNNYTTKIRLKSGSGVIYRNR